VKDDILVDSDALLVTDFVNFKIKLAQSFGWTHVGMMCVCVFIEMSAYTYINIYIYTIFLKNWDIWWNLYRALNMPLGGICVQQIGDGTR
jgi:hypothetical protein